MNMYTALSADSWMLALDTVALTRSCRIISAVEVRQFSAVICSHRTKQLWRKNEPVCNSHRKPMIRILKRRDSVCHDDDVCVSFSKCFPGVLLLI